MRSPVMYNAVLAAALAASLIGCGQEAQPPTGPELATTSGTVLSFHQVTAGSFHTCGLTTDDRAYCWGQNFLGQLGNGSSAARSLTPVAVAGGLHFVQLSAGTSHTCGVTTDNLAYCWGDALLGALGDGTISGHRSTPVPVVGGLRFRQISGGASYTCGVTVDSLAYCWGNAVDILSDSSLAAREFPVAVPGGRKFRQVNAGVHTCGVGADSLAYCWGFNNENGQLGDGTTKRHLIPARVATTVRFRTVVAEFDMSCGISLSHRMYCWGYNAFGELGDGTRTNRLKPVPVSGDRTWGQVGDGSEFYNCGLTLSNQEFCWGLNQQGQLGTGTTGGALTPVAVSGGHAFGFINEGGSFGHTCSVTLTHAAYCWGNNDNGQVGDGTTTERHVPVRVAGVQ